MWLSLINASTTPRIVPKISVRTDISIVTAHPWSSDVILSNTSDHFNVTILFPLWPVIIAGLSFLPYSSGITGHGVTSNALRDAQKSCIRMISRRNSRVFCELCSQQLVFCIEVYTCFIQRFPHLLLQQLLLPHRKHRSILSRVYHKCRLHNTRQYIH